MMHINNYRVSSGINKYLKEKRTRQTKTDTSSHPFRRSIVHASKQRNRNKHMPHSVTRNNSTIPQKVITHQSTMSLCVIPSFHVRDEHQQARPEESEKKRKKTYRTNHHPVTHPPTTSHNFPTHLTFILFRFHFHLRLTPSLGTCQT